MATLCHLGAGCIEAARFTKLDECGVPLAGLANAYAIRQNSDSMGIVDFTSTPDIEEGEESTLKNHCGSICHTFQECDSLKRHDIELKLCNPEPELEALLEGGTPIVDPATGLTIGFHNDTTACYPDFMVEIWERILVDACNDTAPYLYRRHVYTKVRFSKAASEREGKIRTLNYTARGEYNSYESFTHNFTTQGPWNDLTTLDLTAVVDAPNFVMSEFLDIDVPFSGDCGTIEYVVPTP